MDEPRSGADLGERVATESFERLVRSIASKPASLCSRTAMPMAHLTDLKTHTRGPSGRNMCLIPCRPTAVDETRTRLPRR